MARTQPQLKRRSALAQRWRGVTCRKLTRRPCSLARRSYLEFLSKPSVLPLRLLPRVQETIQARPARAAPPLHLPTVVLAT